MTDFFQDGFPAVLPFEDPSWTVSVHLPGSVFVTKNIVAHHRENAFQCGKERQKEREQKRIKAISRA